MFQVTPKLEGLTPYQPITGKFDVRLDANESFLELPWEVRETMAAKLILVEANRYPDPAAAELCKAFSDFYGIDKAFVTGGNGSDELISIIVNCFLSRGDTLLTLDPDFSMYPFYAFLAETTNICLPKDCGLFLTADEIIAALRQYKPQMLLFSNPCNPSSLGLNRADVRRIIQSTDALVVLDEAYMDFWDESLLQEAAEYDNLIILRTLSKLGLAAFRLGFAIANPKLTDLLRAVKSPYNLNTLSQVAGCAVLHHPEILRENIAFIRRQKTELLDSLKALSGKYPNRFEVLESKTNFVTLLMDNPDALRQNLREQSISIALPQGKYPRITAGSPKENAAFLAAFENYIKSLNI